MSFAAVFFKTRTEKIDARRALFMLHTLWVFKELYNTI